MEKAIKTMLISDNSDLKELDVETKKRILSNVFIDIGTDVLELSFDEMGQIVKEMYDAHKIVESLKDGRLDKAIKEVFDNETQQSKH